MGHIMNEYTQDNPLLGHRVGVRDVAEDRVIIRLRLLDAGAGGAQQLHLMADILLEH